VHLPSVVVAPSPPFGGQAPWSCTNERFRPTIWQYFGRDLRCAIPSPFEQLHGLLHSAAAEAACHLLHLSVSNGSAAGPGF
jgi:hypothetical protein